MDDTNHNNEELEKIEEKLIEEDEKAQKQKMLISGRSVFEIKRIKEEETKKG